MKTIAEARAEIARLLETEATGFRVLQHNATTPDRESYRMGQKDAILLIARDIDNILAAIPSRDHHSSTLASLEAASKIAVLAEYFHATTAVMPGGPSVTDDMWRRHNDAHDAVAALGLADDPQGNAIARRHAYLVAFHQAAQSWIGIAKLRMTPEQVASMKVWDDDIDRLWVKHMFAEGMSREGLTSGVFPSYTEERLQELGL